MSKPDTYSDYGFNHLGDLFQRSGYKHEGKQITYEENAFTKSYWLSKFILSFFLFRFLLIFLLFLSCLILKFFAFQR